MATLGNASADEAIAIDADTERRKEILHRRADNLSTATDAGRVYVARLAAWESEGGLVLDDDDSLYLLTPSANRQN